MTATTTYLCDYSYSWAEVNGSRSPNQPRKETTLGLPHVTSLAEVNRIATEALDAGLPHFVRATWHPRTDAEKPTHIGLGSTVLIKHPDLALTGYRERIMAITVTEDDDGRLDYATELNTIKRTVVERQQQRIKAVVLGMVNGVAITRPILIGRP